MNIPGITTSFDKPRYSAAFSGGILVYAFVNNAKVLSCHIPIINTEEKWRVRL